MSLTIQTNIASLNARQSLNAVTDRLRRSYDALSSGLRITRASDDAAGLSIASTLRADARIYSQASRNINDAISMLNIAEGAVSELAKIVIRQKELAEQAANGVYSYTQRTALNQEAAALTTEYNRIIRSTSFNGLQIIDGVDDSLVVQHGIGTREGTEVSLGLALGGFTEDSLVGDGTFSAATSFNTGGTGTETIVSYDFNGDGHLDLVTLNQNNDRVAVMLGAGDGTFGAAASFVVGDGAQYTAIGDINGDGKMDLIVPSSTPDFCVSVLLGNGDGTFLAKLSFSTGGWAFSSTLADFNGDGKLDIATSVANSSVGRMLISIGNGNGTFLAPSTYDIQGGNPYSISHGDFNGDGKLDIVTTSFETNRISLLLGNGNGTFKAPSTFQTVTGPTANARNFVVDVNGDGKLDIVTTGYLGTSVGVHLGNGNGTFNAYTSYYAGSSVYEAVIEDFNGDGKVDMVVVDNGTNKVRVLIGNGNGTFTAPQSFATYADPHTITAGDFNEDGVTDLAVTNYTSGRVSILLGDGVSGGSTFNIEQDDFDISTVSSALSALSSLTTQLNQVQAELGKIGAYQSRLLTSLNTVQLRTEYYTAAQSQIMDVDVAEETMHLTRNKILQQASTAVLAQANQQPALALGLLSQFKQKR